MDGGTMFEVIQNVICDPLAHGRWLNTLSYLENCGARLIARSQHPTMVGKEVLKHAAEEFRHAYFFKAAIRRVWPAGLVDYRAGTLFGGWATHHYLDRLNSQISRLLKEEWGMRGAELRAAAYVLVTLAIEERAMEIYPLYQELLTVHRIPLSIQSIIREESHHLEEIVEMLEEIEGGEAMRLRVREIESALCQRWLDAVKQEEIHGEGTCCDHGKQLWDWSGDSASLCCGGPSPSFAESQGR